MVSQRSPLITAAAMLAVSLAASSGPAGAAGGYAGIDGTSTPVPTPTYRMFTGQPYHGFSTVPTFSNNRFVPPPPRQPIPRQPRGR
jgi:hypothetical protein